VKIYLDQQILKNVLENANIDHKNRYSGKKNLHGQMYLEIATLDKIKQIYLRKHFIKHFNVNLTCKSPGRICIIQWFLKILARESTVARTLTYK
jgi:hypothetical protein